MARSRLVKQIREVVALVVRSERNRLGIPPAFTKRSLSLTLLTPKPFRRLDADNLVAACKPVVDGCKDAALILDDRAQFVDVAYAQEPGALAVRIAVSLWAVW
jgi:Holliday junction resolvase RusA-like endonuclease